MLTKGDLKAIENILDSKLDTKLKPVYQRLDKIGKKLDKTIDAFDHMHLDVVKNVRVIQNILNLPVMDLA